MPILIFGKDCIWVEKSAVYLMEHELPVSGGRRPIHQPARFVGGIVKELNTDFLRYLSRYRSVLIRRYLSGKWDNKAEARLLRRVLMGGVEIALEGKEHLDLFDGIWQCVIHIQA